MKKQMKISIVDRNAIDVVKAKAALDAIADKVLRYRPIPKTTPGRRRKRRKKKIDEAS